MTEKILVVEDDSTLLSVLKYNLTKEKYEVVTATNGAVALDLARQERPDAMILDVMLPEISGFEVCRILRQEMTIPILMLTARDEETDKVVGLDMGADDYVTKPFSMRELLARVRALLRRGQIQGAKPPAGERLKIGDLELDLPQHKIYRAGTELALALKEFDLLTLLLNNPGLVFSRDHLLQKIWGYDYAGDTRTVDVHIRWLREKIEDDPARPRVLITVRGVGYKLEKPGVS